MLLPVFGHDPETDLLAGAAQVFSDDSGNVDLFDSQYVRFNLILLGYFRGRFVDHSGAGIPSLPSSLVSLSGVSTAGYIGKKHVARDAQGSL